MIELIFGAAKTQMDGILNELLFAIGILTVLIFIPAGYLMVKRIIEVVGYSSSIYDAHKIDSNVGSNIIAVPAGQGGRYDDFDLTNDSIFNDENKTSSWDHIHKDRHRGIADSPLDARFSSKANM